MATELKVDSVTKVPDTSSKPLAFKQGFYALESLFHPDKNYDYPFFEGNSQRLMSEGFTKETFEGFLYFCSELPLKSCQNHFLSLQEAITGLGLGKPHLNWGHIPANACENIARTEPGATAEQIAAAIRHTLRDVYLTLHSGPFEALPDKAYGQLLAVLMFIKATPNVPEAASKDADGLFTLLLEMGKTKNTNGIYYYIRDTLGPHFEKTGSWTKTYNSWFGSWFGYKI